MDFNLSLLGKWVWRYFTEPNSLWAMIISAFYGKDGGLSTGVNSNGASSIWAQILRSSSLCKSNGVDIIKANLFKVGNGRKVHFWLDIWNQMNIPLKDAFPRLYALEDAKECTLADRWMKVDNAWVFNTNWRCFPRGRVENELVELRGLLNSISLEDSLDDRSVWALNKSGMFSVKALYDRLQLVKRPVSISSTHTWNSWIPLKVNVLIWKARLNRLPTLDNLCCKRILASHGYCFLCNETLEHLEHTIFSCSKVSGVWRKIWAWWDIAFPLSFGWNSFLEKSGFRFTVDCSYKAFHGVCCIGLWFIWRWRNKVAFVKENEREQLIMKDLFPRIQSSSFLWISNRSKHSNWSWSSWIRNPHDLQ